nr:MAG TPA_asm: hypothetical protein [Caudoviricetes sp.]
MLLSLQSVRYPQEWRRISESSPHTDNPRKEEQ